MLHTKGPWHVFSGDIVNDPDRRVICQALGYGEPDKKPQRGKNEEARANARLIAAAPELLEACKAMHHGMDTLFAMLIQKDPTFLPTKSGVFDAILKGTNAMMKAGASLSTAA